MRIILLLLAALGAVAIAAPAQAQTTSFGSGHRGGAHAPPPAGDFFRTHRGFGHDRARHPRRPRGRFDRRAEPFYLGLGGYGEPASPYGDGFFAGGEVHMDGGRPVYAYDRSYPYEWDSTAALAVPGAGDELDWAAPHCMMEHGVRVCRGRR